MLDEQAILSYLEASGPGLLDLLERLVNIDSFSADKGGVDRAGDVLTAFYQSHGIAIQSRRSDTYGDALIARLGTEARPVLLMGHRDTVFPPGEAGRRPFRIAGGKATGPGVNDMKAGLASIALVMAAFRSCCSSPPPLWSLTTGDEELASPFSRPIIEELADGARVVFNAEPARANGNVVTSRKGGRFMLLELEGKAAHAGVNFFDGASAIHAMAAKIVRLSQATDRRTGTTLNVGLVRGGQTVNTVAPRAACEIDLRFASPAARDAAIAHIDAVVAEREIAGVSATLHLKGEFLPMVATERSLALFDLYRTTARDLGVALDGEFTGSCADSGFTSARGVPTLCGVGAVGDGSHTPDEFVHVDTIIPRAKILALTICRVLAGSHSSPWE